jgi:hypothetical protein
MALTTPAPQAARRLPAVDPNVAKALAVVALGLTTFTLISLHIDNYIAKIAEFEDFL